ncbi:hypothetical protein [Streptomyces sp. NPDC015131]|uniref:hypothetical protein n=1 Tax=Streptomyces sp. NPDC015131 TaxID=3364941 RepID=UPI0036FB8CB9
MKPTVTNADMLKVRQYNGDWWLFLEYADGHAETIARFPNDTCRELFWEWHADRVAGLVDEVMAAVHSTEVLPGLGFPDSVSLREAITKILTGDTG